MRTPAIIAFYSPREPRTGTTKEDDSILWASDEEAKRVAKNALDSAAPNEYSMNSTLSENFIEFQT